MANVNTFNLTVYLLTGDVTFRGISRVAVKRYIAHYRTSEFYSGYRVEDR